MSARLGRQFSTLTALAEIDRLILSSPDTEQIVRSVLERLGSLVPVELLSITLLDHDNPNLARTYAREANRLRDVSARQEVSASARALLEASPHGFWISLSDGAGYLSHLRDQGMATAYVQPIIWREAVCGALALGFRSTPAIGGEDQKQIRDFADRVAVAISSAWRDEQLYQQAHFDSLTGLPNRLLLRGSADAGDRKVPAGDRFVRRLLPSPPTDSLWLTSRLARGTDPAESRPPRTPIIA